MELKQLMTVFKRWSWLLILGLLVGAVGGFAASKILTPTYEGKTKVLITRTQQQKNSDTVYLNEQQFIDTYIELLKTEPILEAASSKLGFEIDDKKIRVEQVRTTQVVDVIAEDSNPERAAAIANALVTALLEQKSSLESSRYEAAEKALQSQIAQIETQMSSLQGQLTTTRSADVQNQLSQVDAQIAGLHDQSAKIQEEIKRLTPAITQAQQAELAQQEEELSHIDSILYLYQQVRTNLLFIGKPSESGSGPEAPQVIQLQSTLDLYREIYVTLLSDLESVKAAKAQNTQVISQAEVAAVPKTPVRPLPSIYTALAGMVGLLVAACAAFLLEYLDDTIKTVEDVERILEVPVIGSIAETPYLGESDSGIYLVSHPNTPTAEAFRLLRINFNFSKGGKPLKTLAVLSPNVGDGKTTIAVNLAALFAQGGKQVSLVDANARQPEVHKILGIENQGGFNEIWSGSSDIQSVHYSLGEGQGFDVIPGGVLPINPAELLEVSNMERAIARIKSNANIIIIDGPPVAFAEAQVLASKVDGVLLVMRPGTINPEMGRTMTAQLKRVGANIIGVAMNRVGSRKFSFRLFGNLRLLRNRRNRLTSPLNPKSTADIENKEESIQDSA